MNALAYPTPDAYRRVGEDVKREAARINRVSCLRDEVIAAWRSAPLTQVRPMWAYAPPGKTVALCTDVAAWVCETERDPDAVLGFALHDATARVDLVHRYATARAELLAERSNVAGMEG